jgi:hypothetical protein
LAKLTLPQKWEIEDNHILTGGATIPLCPARGFKAIEIAGSFSSQE